MDNSKNQQSISGRQNEKNQHKVFVIGFLLIVLVLLWFLAKPFVADWRNGQKNPDEQRANAEILKAPSVLPEDIFKKIGDKSKIILIDISAPDDFKRGHIATAMNAPAEKLDKDFFKNMKMEETADIFLMNQGSDLAGLAASVNKVVAAGFVNAKYLRGGISGWREKGYPLVSSGGSETDGAKVKRITIDEIKQEAGANADLLQFLDVRDADAYTTERIVGAINIPMPEIEARKNDVPAAKKIIVYGADDKQGFQAAVMLFDLNFFNVWRMEGGIDEWKAAGGNVAGGN